MIGIKPTLVNRLCWVIYVLVVVIIAMVFVTTKAHDVGYAELHLLQARVAQLELQAKATSIQKYENVSK